MPSDAESRDLAPQLDGLAETLEGIVERVTFHNPDNGFAVLKVRVKRRPDLATVVGRTPVVAIGEIVEARGRWLNDRVHGLQFKADTLTTAPPTSKRGIERYLASGAVKGIGDRLAARIVQHFGDKAFDILEREPERLAEIEGISAKQATKFAEGFAAGKGVRDVMVFLHQHGVGTARAARIQGELGKDAIGLIRKDPYLLARRVEGIGFRSADAIAQQLGITGAAPRRLAAGLAWALSEATQDGHCGLPIEELVPFAAKLLEVEETAIETALAQEIASAGIVADRIGERACVFLPRLHEAEKVIAERLKAQAAGKAPWAAVDPEAAITAVAGRGDFRLSGSQEAALRLVLGAKVAVVTGGPGVGKTTLLDTILRSMPKGITIALGAPTGRAAKRMTEQTGREAKTLHRLLEIDPRNGPARRPGDPLDCDLLVVDETSMVDVPLMRMVVEALPEKAGLILVGDVDQLPSVGPGRVLADIIQSGAVPVARLTEIFRQAAESRIVVNAHRINQGEMPLLPAPGEMSDFFFVEAADPEDGARKVVEIVRERIPRRFGLDPIREVQVLSPMQKGAMGTRSLNVLLQAALNPAPPARVERGGLSYSPGDKVMQIVNDYDREVFNGDLGTLSAIDEGQGRLTVQFDGREVHYGLEDLESLLPAFATTIHKSQGSEYPAVVVVVSSQHWPMLARNLLYTAVTRGKRLVVLVGDRRALAVSVAGGAMRPRWTKLAEWLAAG